MPGPQSASVRAFSPSACVQEKVAPMRSIRFLAAPLLLAALAAALAPARAALFGDDEARKAILELRDTVTELDRRQNERILALTQRIEQLENRIEALQHGMSESADRVEAGGQDMAKLRGLVEKLANDIAVAQKSEHDLYADLDQRIRKLEPTNVTFDGRSAPVARDEQAAYDTAVGLFRTSDFRGAIHALESFVGRYPQSVYAPVAQFWLGSSYYAVKDFPDAIIAQQALIERFPDSPRIPEALLNIAASQLELNDRKSARATLARIGTDFPNSDAAKLAADRLAALPADEAKDAKKAAKDKKK